MHCIATKFVPWLLTNDRKQLPINVGLELWEKANEDPTFISKVITGDESWIYGYEYDPETTQQSSHWKSPQSPRIKKAWPVRSSTKSMLIVVIGVKGIVHCEFVHPNTTANSDFYCDVLRRLRENMRHKKTGTLAQHSLPLHHDNSPAHTSLKSQSL
jgi:hypothetical protein